MQFQMYIDEYWITNNLDLNVNPVTVKIFENQLVKQGWKKKPQKNVEEMLKSWTKILKKPFSKKSWRNDENILQKV